MGVQRKIQTVKSIFFPLSLSLSLFSLPPNTPGHFSCWVVAAVWQLRPCPLADVHGCQALLLRVAFLLISASLPSSSSKKRQEVPKGEAGSDYHRIGFTSP